MGAGWPLVGRQAELEAALAHCCAGGVLLSGPAGVGKTRLAGEVVARLAPAPVVRVRATEVTSRMPLGAFAQVLAASGQALGPAARLADAATQLLSGLAPAERLVVSVDDAHLLDDTSATLLLHLATSDRVVLVMTLRTAEPVPVPVTVLWRDELVGRVDLSALGPGSMQELLEVALPGGIDPHARATLLAACAGNLLYLRELVGGLTESGTLDRSRGQWELTGPISAPPRLAELVELRLESLSDPARSLLGAVAFAEPMGVHAVEAAGASELLRELVDAGMVEVVEDGRRRQLRPVHPLHVEVVRATMHERQRLEILDRLADTLERGGCRRRDDARRLATWRLGAGRPADPEVLVDAAREALWGSDAVMVERFARAALDSAEAGAAVRMDAAHLLATGLDDLGRFEEAEAVLAVHEPGTLDQGARTMLALARSANLFRGLGRLDDALGVLDAAELVVSDVELLDELRAQRASFAVFAGQVRSTLELTAPLLEGSSDRAYCEGALQASVAHMLAGRTDLARHIATTAFETRVRLGDQVQLAEPGIHLVALALAQLEAGLLREAWDTAIAAYDVAVSLGDRHGQAWLAVVLCRADLLAGRLGAAAQRGREAALVFGALRHPGSRWGLGGLALAAGQAGDVDAAGAAVEDLSAEPPTPLVLMDVDLDRGRAWALAAAGRHSAARDQLDEAGRRARSLGQYALEAGVLHDLARLGAAPAVAPRLAELCSLVDGDLVRARRDLASALADDDGAALDEVALRFAAMGADLFAAESATAAAAAHRRRGDTRAGAASEVSARACLARSGPAATPMLHVVPGHDELTRREREVAALAASGRTNRAIAEELVVSVRTVENHLQRAYAKLGVSSRDELGPLLGIVAGRSTDDQEPIAP